VIVNTDGFYAPLLKLLDRSIECRFMDERHRAMWSVVAEPEEVLDAICNAPLWKRENRSFATSF
jgi:predicted Rossmann-fold nucleotide-binding protein